jgi:hypothetical protein
MAEVHTIEHRGSEKLRGRDRRSLNLSTKLTAVEAKAIEDAASRAGKTPSEWAHEMLLRSDVVGSHTEMEMHIFTELVGIQMLLMGTLEPLLRGEKMVQDQITTSIGGSKWLNFTQSNTEAQRSCAGVIAVRST